MRWGNNLKQMIGSPSWRLGWWLLSSKKTVHCPESGMLGRGKWLQVRLLQQFHRDTVRPGCFVWFKVFEKLGSSFTANSDVIHGWMKAGAKIRDWWITVISKYWRELPVQDVSFMLEIAVKNISLLQRCNSHLITAFRFYQRSQLLIAMWVTTDYVRQVFAIGLATDLLRFLIDVVAPPLLVRVGFFMTCV